jgi:hypothetical protein
MPDLLQVERARELEYKARERCQAAIAEAAVAKRKAEAELDRAIAADYDQLRIKQAALRLERPRTPELTEQIAEIGQLMSSWRTSPPERDLADIQSEYDRLVKLADDALKVAVADIRIRLRRGEPLELPL